MTALLMTFRQKHHTETAMERHPFWLRLRRAALPARKLVPNLGVLADVEIALFDQNVGQFPATADVALKAADNALERIESLYPKNKVIDPIRMNISIRQ